MPRYYFYPRSPCGERPNLLISEASANIFLSTLSLRRATATCTIWAYTNKFLSTLSLRRATVTAHTWQGGTTDFYPRSPCGERLFEPKHEHHNFRYFYPRSPCGERRGTLPRRCRSGLISIHALLAESDSIRLAGAASPPNISIHALLAESDASLWISEPSAKIFLSTLSLRRATVWPHQRHFPVDISIHALLAESDNSLLTSVVSSADFYPRSPCGERPQKRYHGSPPAGISIHALLAESDCKVRVIHHDKPRFLSTLSLRRAT